MSTYTVRVCNGVPCSRSGAKRLMRIIKKATGLKPGKKDATMDLDFCSCLGYCSMSPNIEVQDSDGNVGMVFTPEDENVMKAIYAGGEIQEEGNVIDADSLFDDFLVDN